MATDYDVPSADARATPAADREAIADGSLRTDPSTGQAQQTGRDADGAAALGGHPSLSATALLDQAELEAADSFDLPGADLSSEEIAVQILAAQADEFTCASCFLVRHRSQIAVDRDGRLYCTDCEG